MSELRGPEQAHGASEKTVERLTRAEKQNHCATCHGGHFLSGKDCKAFGCTKGAGEKCQTCVAQGHRKAGWKSLNREPR